MGKGFCIMFLLTMIQVSIREMEAGWLVGWVVFILLARFQYGIYNNFIIIIHIPFIYAYIHRYKKARPLCPCVVVVGLIKTQFSDAQRLELGAILHGFIGTREPYILFYM